MSPDPQEPSSPPSHLLSMGSLPNKVQVCCTTIPHHVVISVCGGPAQECLSSTDGATYRGSETTTENSYTCQRWDQQTPHPHTETDPSRFPDQTLDCAANHCRNPGGAKARPWCQTTDPFIAWDHCSIPSC